VYQAGTLSGNPLAMAAGLAQLREMERLDGYNKLEQLGQIMEDAVLDVLKHDRPWLPVVSPRAARSACSSPKRRCATCTDAKTSDIPAFRKFFHKCLEDGVHFAPSQFETGFISLAHSPDDLARTAEVVQGALKSL